MTECRKTTTKSVSTYTLPSIIEINEDSLCLEVTTLKGVGSTMRGGLHDIMALSGFGNEVLAWLLLHQSY